MTFKWLGIKFNLAHRTIIYDSYIFLIFVDNKSFHVITSVRKSKSLWGQALHCWRHIQVRMPEKDGAWKEHAFRRVDTACCQTHPQYFEANSTLPASLLFPHCFLCLTPERCQCAGGHCSTPHAHFVSGHIVQCSSGGCFCQTCRSWCSGLVWNCASCEWQMKMRWNEIWEERD